MWRRPGYAASTSILGIALLAACGGASNHPKPVTKPDASSGAPPSSLAAAVEPIASVGCEVRTDGPVDSEGKLEIFTSSLDGSSGRPVAEIRYETATFFLPTGEAGQLAGVEASGWGMSLSALVRVEAVPLWVRPTRALASGMLIPGQGTRVKVQKTGSGTLQVRIDHHELLDARRLPLVETVSCNDLQATPPAWSGSGPGREVSLRVGDEGLAVSAFAGASAEESLFVIAPPGVTGDILDGRELERRGDAARVEIPSADGDLRGWVAASAVLPPQHAHLAGLLNRTPVPSPTLALPDRRVCDKPLRFAVLVADRAEPVWLGDLRAQTTLARDLQTTTGVPDGWAPIEVVGVGGRLVARTSELDACAAPKE